MKRNGAKPIVKNRTKPLVKNGTEQNGSEPIVKNEAEAEWGGPQLDNCNCGSTKLSTEKSREKRSKSLKV